MQSRLIILQGGEDVNKRTHEKLFMKLANGSERGTILIVPWTSAEKEKDHKYRTILEKYFHDTGFRTVTFMERDDEVAAIEKKFESADVIYLPGGDPEVLYREMKNRSLDKRISTFKGVIVGNSAGAIVLSKGTTREGRFYPGFGIVKTLISVHYDVGKGIPSGNSKEMILNIPEDAWISVEQPE